LKTSAHETSQNLIKTVTLYSKWHNDCLIAFVFNLSTLIALSNFRKDVAKILTLLLCSLN